MDYTTNLHYTLLILVSHLDPYPTMGQMMLEIIIFVFDPISKLLPWNVSSVFP